MLCTIGRIGAVIISQQLAQRPLSPYSPVAKLSLWDADLIATTCTCFAPNTPVSPCNPFSRKGISPGRQHSARCGKLKPGESWWSGTKDTGCNIFHESTCVFITFFCSLYFFHCVKLCMLLYHIDTFNKHAYMHRYIHRYINKLIHTYIHLDFFCLFLLGNIRTVDSPNRAAPMAKWSKHCVMFTR